MAKRQDKKKKKKRAASSGRGAPRKAGSTGRNDTTRSPETRAAEAVTVAWMLAATATLMGSLAGLALWLFLRGVESAETETNILPLVMLFAARLSSLIALALTPAAYRVRKVKPPKLVTCAVLLIVALPWILAATLPAPN